MKISRNSRVNAARLVARVMLGHSLDECFTGLPATAPEQAFTKALVYGVVREHRLLSALLDRMLDKPLGRDPLLHALLLCGLQQLRGMDVAAHAALNETVAATGELERAPARGLVNAVLRRYQREASGLEGAFSMQPAVETSHPDWLLAQLQADWPERWREILRANNRQAPMTLRINRRALTREDWLQRAAGIGIAARAVEGAPDAVVLAEPRPVAKIPGFNSGQASVQDASAQLAVDLLDLRDGLRVLDACAAPGGKTAHMLERHTLDLVAVDSDPKRLIRVDENLRRMKLQAKLVSGDAGEPARWHEGRPYDRILLDAPCSGTGVIRRHPDIKWLRRDTDIAAMAQQQLRLLRALWPQLAAGGKLVYATCSVLAAEGDEVINKFRLLAEEVEVLPIAAAWGEPGQHGRRIAPSEDWDGFYYAVLQKKQKR